MNYRTARTTLVTGAERLPPRRYGTRTRRLWNAFADLSLTPLALLEDHRSVLVNGVEVPLELGKRRWAWRTERCLEIGLARKAYSAASPSEILEVGNVLPLTGIRGHTVVDKYETGSGVTNIDIIDFNPEATFGLLISLSTLEHVGWDEVPEDETKASAALEHMGRLARRLLITIPAGYHRRLQKEFLRGPFDSVHLFLKTGRIAQWEERSLDLIDEISYASPYACGNGILVGMRGNPLT